MGYFCMLKEQGFVEAPLCLDGPRVPALLSDFQLKKDKKKDWLCSHKSRDRIILYQLNVQSCYSKRSAFVFSRSLAELVFLFIFYIDAEWHSTHCSDFTMGVLMYFRYSVSYFFLLFFICDLTSGKVTFRGPRNLLCDWMYAVTYGIFFPICHMEFTVTETA